MKRKSKRRNSWRRYEAKKKLLAARGLTPAAYEKALRELTKKLKLYRPSPRPGHQGRGGSTAVKTGQ